ncbi:hypothetical protein IE077_003894 [Cardiosporidium cionae]|uniref:SS18 N-terminal domain-containing protein n=1 Tax=Cardiosporidium cionae TaxID=476202 RepID=A0ABQ7JER8_9APIC|nr:hypothetical protein IE077_003894 [Cardiosporidium cionae]|eukprot:KAF8822374.1 hypothetical protein IE077_003894 [Cardiosporidium cionae]
MATLATPANPSHLSPENLLSSDGQVIHRPCSFSPVVSEQEAISVPSIAESPSLSPSHHVEETRELNLLERIEIALGTLEKRSGEHRKCENIERIESVQSTPSSASLLPAVNDDTKLHNSKAHENPLLPPKTVSNDAIYSSFMQTNKYMIESCRGKVTGDLSDIPKTLSKELSPFSKDTEVSTKLVQQMLEENQQLLYAAHENLRMERAMELAPLFGKLQQNLLFLALIADQPFCKESEKIVMPISHEEYMKNPDFWTEAEIDRLYQALRRPNQDLAQLEAAVKTKTSNQIHYFLKLSAERYKMRLWSLPELDVRWSSLTESSQVNLQAKSDEPYQQVGFPKLFESSSNQEHTEKAIIVPKMASIGTASGEKVPSP